MTPLHLLVKTHRAWCLAAAAIIAAGLPAGGQSIPAGGTPAASQPQQGLITFSPQRVETPELRFTLLPRVEDTNRGNSAVKFIQAVSEMPRLEAQDLDALENWRTVPLAELKPSDEHMQHVMSEFRTSLRLAREGSLLEDVDWESNVRINGAAALLPSLGKMHQFSKALAVQTRLNIQRHDWKAAQENLQTGYVLARHLGQGETLIESLVGVAIAGNMNRAIEDWISEPGSPNLYWDLSNLPSPFNDLRHPMHYERGLAYFSLPSMREARAGRYSPDIWFNLVSQVQGDISTFADAGHSPSVGSSEIRRQATGTAAALVFYPIAKTYLVEHGRTPAEVEALPVPEVLERYFLDSWEDAGDNCSKWMGLPPSQSIPGLQAWEQQLIADKASNRVNPLAAMMLPSLGRAIANVVRLDRQIGGLRLVEAVRAYTAEKGALPTRLEDLTLPLPIDPLARGYTLQRVGDAVIIEAGSDTPRNTIRYELHLRK